MALARPHSRIEAKGGEMNEQSILDATTVADVMHNGVVTCSLYAPMTDVARKMATNRIHCVVVWNEPARNETAELWGVVSDLDLVRVAAAEDLSVRTAGESAATPPLTISRDETLRRAAQMMAEHEMTHLVVVDPSTKKPVGVLSTLDVSAVLGGVGEPVVP
jgi:CBS domain-containing protein